MPKKSLKSKSRSRSSRSISPYIDENDIGFDVIGLVNVNIKEWLRESDNNIVFKLKNKYYLTDYDRLTDDMNKNYYECDKNGLIKKDYIYCKLKFSSIEHHVLRLDKNTPDFLFQNDEGSGSSVPMDNRLFVLTPNKKSLFLCETNQKYDPELIKNPSKIKEEECHDNIQTYVSVTVKKGILKTRQGGSKTRKRR
jgi:hypothetical protein